MSKENKFDCLGIPVRADETRSAAVCKNDSGEERVVIAARGYALIVDPSSGLCRQIPFEEGRNDYPFASTSRRSGLFITGAGPLMIVLDPFKEELVSRLQPAPGEEIVGFAFAEDKEGIIYATTYPNSKLLRLDPITGECEILTQLDSKQKYAMSLAAGNDGWIYAGVGTTAAGIVAYCLSDGMIEALGNQGSVVQGSGYVHFGEDGEVYGRLPAANALGYRWFWLRGGEATPVEEASVSPSLYKGNGYRKLFKDLNGGRRVVSYELADEELVIAEKDGRRTVLKLTYQGGGTALSPITAGPDGNLYGTSNHPLHLYRYNPVLNELKNFGGKIVEGGGGGNICAYASQGPYLIGAAYAGGLLHLFDTRRPLNEETGAYRNPKLLYADGRIHRPRSAHAHPDGIHVLYGGFPDYGFVGGALGILNISSQTVTIHDHKEIVPYQSTLCLAALSSGDIIGGTSIETPGGAEPIAKEAVLYRFNWKKGTVSERWRPVPDVREISLLVADTNDRIFGLTSNAIFFVFDPGTGTVLLQQDLSKWGTIVRQGLLLTTHRGEPFILGLLSHSLFTVDPESFETNQLAILPKDATSGLALIEGNVYFGCGAELWRYKWGEGGAQ